MIKHAIKQVIREDSEQKYEFSAPIETFDEIPVKTPTNPTHPTFAWVCSFLSEG